MRKASTLFFIAPIATLFLFSCAPRPRVSAPAGLILRAAPASSAAALATIPFRTELKAIETSAEKVKIEGIEAPWQKVSYEGKEGWVFSGFLTNDAAVLDRIEKCPATHRVYGQECIPIWQYGLQSQGLVIPVENDCGYRHLLKPDGTVDGFQPKGGCGNGPFRGGLGRWEIEGDRIRVNARTSFCYDTGDPMMAQGEGMPFQRYYLSPRANGFVPMDEKGKPLTVCFVNCCA